MAYSAAHVQALKDIRAELKREGKSFIAVSARQLRKNSTYNYTLNDIYV